MAGKIDWGNKEEVRVYFRERQAAYRERHRDVLLSRRPVECEKRKKRYWENPEKHRAQKRESQQRCYYRIGGREAQARRSRLWYQRNPEKGRAALRRKRYRRMNAVGSYTPEQWMQKVSYWGWRCWMCRKPLNIDILTQDHVLPVSKKHLNWLSNLRPACQSCNSRKCDKMLPLKQCAA